ncbi:hypothetical protein D4764_04G0015150, partial [Takifugu flavidus]
MHIFESLKVHKMEMHAFLFLSCFVLAVIEYLFGAAHMVPEERLSSNRVAVSGALSPSFEAAPPPVVIVALPKSGKKFNKTKRPKK